MKRGALAALIGAAASLAGCAPIARFEPVGAPLQDAARVVHQQQSLATGGDSVVLLVYGDNRPGWRVQSRAVEFSWLRGLKSGTVSGVLKGIAALPIVLIESIVPALDGPRDAIDVMRKRPTGGGENRVLRALEREPASAVVSLGDIVQDGRRGRLWNDWWTKHRALRERLPYLAVPGNHERLSDSTARANFDAAIERPGRTDAWRQWYAIELPDAEARLYVIDSDLLADVKHAYPDEVEHPLADQQLAWLDAELARPARFKLVALHHPLVVAGSHESDWEGEGTEDLVPARRDQLLEMCARHGVTAVLAGHEHLYQRVFVRTPHGGFWHLTSGGGGSPLHVLPHDARTRVLAQSLPAGFSLDPATLVQRRTYEYLRIVLPASARAGADGSRTAPASVSVKQVAISGAAQVFDSFVIQTPESRP